jgi:hypothetical protein
MSKRKTDRSSRRSFTWGIRSTELAIVQNLLESQPLGSTADCGCSYARPDASRRGRRAPRRVAP